MKLKIKKEFMIKVIFGNDNYEESVIMSKVCNQDNIHETYEMIYFKIKELDYNYKVRYFELKPKQEI